MSQHADALLAAGRRAHEAGDLDAAIAAYQQALSTQENDPRTLYLLGNVLMQAGQTQAALPHLEAAASHERKHPAVIGSLAQGYFEAGRYGEAEGAFRKAIRLDPRIPQFQLGLANSLAMQQKFAEAEILLKRLVSREPRSAYAWMNLGNLARDQSRMEEAVNHYRQALQCDPSLLDARNNLGSALHTLLRFEEAEREYRACIAADADFLVARSNLVSVLIDLGRFAEAEAQCRDMLRAEPEFANAHALLATAIAAQSRLTEALPHFRSAAALSPATQRYGATYATALCELGQVEDGLREFGRLLKQPGDTQVFEQMLMPVLLGNGFLSEGWSRHRVRPTYFRICAHFTRLNLQQSLPVPLAGKHIGLVCEQGLGDELFFLRFAPHLKALGVRITYCASPKLGAMLKRVGCIDAVVTDADALPQCDANILVGDLPHALDELDDALPRHCDDHAPGSLLHDYPWQRPPYAALPPRSLRIAPLPDMIAQVRERLARAGPPPYLGITWRGGTAPDHQRGAEWKLFKEIPILQLAQALGGWRGTFLALQRNPAADELAAIQTALGRPVADFTDINDDLEQMLALMDLIEDYVGVSNTNMHLRAAAGHCARVLVPAPADWRWTPAGMSPWFPGFAVYRQLPDSRWDDALAALGRDLAKA